jgi:hypothetical protein
VLFVLLCHYFFIVSKPISNVKQNLFEVDKHTAVAIHRGQKTETLTIRFDPQDLAKLREQADERGMGPTTLVRMWCSSTSAATTRADTGTQVPRSRAREHGRRRRPVFGGSETLLFGGPEGNAS